MKDVSVSMAVPTRHSERPEQVQDRVGVIFSTHENPHVDAVLTQDRQQFRSEADMYIESYGPPPSSRAEHMPHTSPLDL